MGLKIGTVKLEKYNYKWKEMFNKEKENLKEIFDNIALEIEHIGSTSIENISAKPIIDIAIGVKKLNDFESKRKYFEKEPYSIKDNYDCDEILVRKRNGDITTFLIHIMEIEGKRYKDTIIFRDYIRNHKETFEEYEKLKKKLAEVYADNRPMYTASKNDFIQGVLKKAYEEKNCKNTL